MSVHDYTSEMLKATRRLFAVPTAALPEQATSDSSLQHRHFVVGTKTFKIGCKLGIHGLLTMVTVYLFVI